jgi:putative Mn2+ efflux pump MntP
MGAVIFILYKGVPVQTSKNPTEGLAILISSYAGALVGLTLAALGAGIGALLLRWAGNTAKRVIPPEDRQLLGNLVTQEKEKGIDLYVRLSSLIGVTGIFTRLGLVGLPLATIGLTLIFTALSLGGKTDYMDLTKLTLGAFIGSYVQRQAPPSAGLPSR